MKKVICFVLMLYLFFINVSFVYPQFSENEKYFIKNILPNLSTAFWKNANFFENLNLKLFMRSESYRNMIQDEAISLRTEVNKIYGDIDSIYFCEDNQLFISLLDLLKDKCNMYVKTFNLILNFNDDTNIVYFMQDLIKMLKKITKLQKKENFLLRRYNKNIEERLKSTR
ncbi:MAG: hypothetical protein JRI44_12435 [Deltaproteobacteria bacterium]|nr:hypothetical protein [Deltaproteobacteria bacterium]